MMMMNLDQLYARFPTPESCIAYLEQLRWGGAPVCPDCGSAQVTAMRREHRHHCNKCNVSFSVTVRTVFHGSRVELQKWFRTIALTVEVIEATTTWLVGEQRRNRRLWYYEEVSETQVRVFDLRRVPARELGQELGVNRNTAWLMTDRIREASEDQRRLLALIAKEVTA